MNAKRFSKLLLAVALALVPACAEIRLPALISDHAMLQAEKPIPIWGWAQPGTQVKVVFTGGGGTSESFSATSDGSGRWSGQLAPLKCGVSGQITCSAGRGMRKTVRDVLVGEVWLAGGQSNMVYSVAGKTGADPTNPVEVAEIAQNIVTAQKEASDRQQPIRYFQVTSRGAEIPADDVKGQWVEANSANVSSFSAVAWNFGVALQNKMHVPVGLIASCVGGTPIEAWMSKPALEATTAGAAVLDRHRKALAAVTPELVTQHDVETKAWDQANPTEDLQFKNAASRPAPIYSATYGKAPVALYNGMIHGLQSYALRGIIWFQADGNIKYPTEYSELFQALINQWRADWKEPLPFYFVEMNNMSQQKQSRPVKSHGLCLIREQQHGGLKLPGVGMASSIDLGTRNAHFPYKKPVGERLAALAMNDCYHLQMGQVNSPMFKSYAVEGQQVRLKFADAVGLRVRGGSEMKGFAIRGAGNPWVWANGKLDGQDIVVWSDRVPSPVAVRYAWAANPVISIENGAGLPLCPFRTDPESKE